MAEEPLSFVIPRHCVALNDEGLSDFQSRLIDCPSKVRLCSAPTGAGKSHAFVVAASRGARVLFVVPTRRLAQDIAASAIDQMSTLPGWNPARAISSVAIWSSDATRTLKEADPTVRVGHLRVRQVRGLGSAPGFIVSTPETLAGMLLDGTGSALGTTGFGLADLEHVDHVVFDEFHVLDERAFGLYATAAALAGQDGAETKVTFLSATPVGIDHVLIEAGVPATAIEHLAEQVFTTPAMSIDGCRLRPLHGDVRCTFVPDEDPVAVLRAMRDEATACMSSGRQVVLVFDRLEALLSSKRAMAALLDELGVARDERLAINSVDDRWDGAAISDTFTVGAGKDPRTFRFVAATSSIEVGVNLRPGLMVTDPGHDVTSLAQRVGRVARGEYEGQVVVLASARSTGKHPWLRTALGKWRDCQADGNMDIHTFLAVLRDAARERYAGAVESDRPASDLTYRRFGRRAVWCAALFWLGIADRRFKGQRDAVQSFMPANAEKIRRMLRHAAKPIATKEGSGKRWVEAFMTRALTLREFAPRVTVVEPSGRRSSLPLTLVNSRPSLAGAPMLPEGNDGYALHIGCALETLLSIDERRFVEATCEVVMPFDGSVTMPCRGLVIDTLADMRRQLARCPPRQRTRLETCCELVAMTGVVPVDDSMPALPSFSSLTL